MRLGSRQKRIDSETAFGNHSKIKNPITIKREKQDPENKKAADPFGASRSWNRRRDYFFSSFFGLHFSQVLPSLAAFTQQA